MVSFAQAACSPACSPMDGGVFPQTVPFQGFDKARRVGFIHDDLKPRHWQKMRSFVGGGYGGVHGGIRVMMTHVWWSFKDQEL